jgi:hypothetical protein
VQPAADLLQILGVWCGASPSHAGIYPQNHKLGRRSMDLFQLLRENFAVDSLQIQRSHRSSPNLPLMAAIGNKKAGEGLPLRLFQGVGRRLVRLLLLQLEELVLDAELLAFQIGDRVVVRKGAMDLLIDGAFERCVLLSERLDAILHRHAVSSS